MLDVLPCTLNARKGCTLYVPEVSILFHFQFYDLHMAVAGLRDRFRGGAILLKHSLQNR